MADKKNYAGFGIRFLAALIDLAVLAVIQRLAAFSFRPPLEGLVLFTLFLGYAPVMLFCCQATLGKRLLELKVIPEQGKKLALGPILMREWLGKFLSVLVLGLGFVWVVFDEKKQGWHDRLAKTLVVKEK